jgi:hypothetical protein
MILRFVIPAAMASPLQMFEEMTVRALADTLQTESCMFKGKFSKERDTSLYKAIGKARLNKVAVLMSSCHFAARLILWNRSVKA